MKGDARRLRLCFNNIQGARIIRRGMKAITKNLRIWERRLKAAGLSMMTGLSTRIVYVGSATELSKLEEDGYEIIPTRFGSGPDYWSTVRAKKKRNV